MMTIAEIVYDRLIQSHIPWATSSIDIQFLTHTKCHPVLS